MRKIASLLPVLMLLCALAFGQTRTVTGRITDEKGDPVPFATVIIKGTKKGTSADADGRFSVVAKTGDVLVVSAQGMETKEFNVGTSSALDLSLKSSSATLQEVVVTTAFGIKKEQRTTPFSAQVIKSEDLTIIPQTNINDALAGKIAGVQFRSQSGTKLDNQSFARIRGGLSLSGDVGPIFVVDGTIVNNAYDIDPESVESLTVLKGANATALFGSKAINGAIVITSKKATAGKSIVQVNEGVTLDRVYRLPKLQNVYGGGGVDHFTTYHYKAGDPQEWQALDGVGFPDYTDDASWGPKFEGQVYAPWYAWVPGSKYSGKTALWNPQPNNIKDFWETGLTNNTNVSFSKAGQNYNTRLAFGKQYISGLIPNSSSDRYNISSVTNVDINSRVSAGIDFTYTVQKLVGEYADYYANQSSGNFGQWNHRDLDMGIMKELRGLKTPIGTLASWNWASNPDGYDPSNPAGFFAGNYWYNFYSYQDNLNWVQNRGRLYGNTYIKVKVTNDIDIKGTVRRDQFNYYNENITRSILETSGSQTGLKAAYSTGQVYQTEMNYELAASYRKNFLHNDLGVSLLVGGNINTYNRSDLSASTANGLNIPDYYALNNSKSQPTTSNGRYRSKTNSLFATGDLEYKKFVSATFAVREDFSSPLPTNKNKLVYPSAGFSFIPSEFTKDALPWLSFAKVYGSWGKKPLSLDIYQNNFFYPVNQYQWFGNILMTTADAVPDPNLKGSLITSYEAGVELRFLKNRLGVNINYYNENAKDQPVQVNVDGVSGFTAKIINSATVERHGFEFTVDGAIIQNKNFNWRVTKTLGWLVKNPVTEIVEGQTRIQPSGWAGAFGSRYATAYQVLNKDWGQLIGGGFSKSTDGKPLIDPTTGLYVTGDQNYDWGSVVPKITGGLQNLFTYKNISLNISLDYQFGGKFFSLTESWGMYSGLLDYTASTNDRGKNVRDPLAEGGGVHVTGVSSVDGKTPIDMYVDGFTYFHQFYSKKVAEPFVHDLSYVKLREVSLGYNLPVKKWNITGKWLQNANFSVIARNLWLIYSATKNFDPAEISGVYGEDGQLPSVRSLGVNLSLTF
jgi:TonB-linked SusC/RagA family outer membrane protein